METTLKDQKFLAWSSAPEDIEIIRAKDSYLYDSDGKEYIDFIMGWCVGNFGWGNNEILNSIQDFSGPVYSYPAFKYSPWTELASLLADITPGNLTKSFRATGGTDAVEAAMKIAMIYTGRKKFLSVEGCYHGNSIAALSIGSSSNKDTYPNLLSNCYRIHRPLTEKVLDDAEELLKQKDIAALILEPILTHPGIHIPEKEFMSAIQEKCSKYGTLLVMDEVATGFGRTGRLFGSEHYNIEPDIICLAKSISGGYAPIGAVVTTEEIGSMVEKKIHSYPTYGWHPLSTRIAIASISYLMKHQNEILKNVEDLSDHFRLRITKMKFKDPITVNIMGLMIGIDVGSAAYAAQIASKCLKKGLLIEHNGTSLIMFPALTLNMEVANKGLDILEDCLKGF